jgi:hypothetical protein
MCNVQTNDKLPKYNINTIKSKINVNKIIKDMYKTEMVTKISDAQLSEYHCNTGYYVTFDIVYRFGFMKI